MFVVSGSGFSSHSVMLERFTNECPNCNLNIDEGLIARLCTDSKCGSEIKNSTRTTQSSLYFYVTYENHFYNYRRTITHVEVYINGALVNSTTGYNITSGFIGTN